MGNGSSRVALGCFVVKVKQRKEGLDLSADEHEHEGLGLGLGLGLGHSFCYVRRRRRRIGFGSDSPPITSSSASERFDSSTLTLDSETTLSLTGSSFRHNDLFFLEDFPHAAATKSNNTFKTISGASVSANASAVRTGNQAALLASDLQEPAASFESTSSFAAIPLQPAPHGFMSGPLERAFASGPLDRAAAAFITMSGPIEKGVMLSGPIDPADKSNFSAPLASGRPKLRLHRLIRSVSGPMKNTLSRTFAKHSMAASGWIHRFFLHPITQLPWHPKEFPRDSDPADASQVGEYRSTRNLQWAHGKAGEDRVHVVLSEEQGWLFIGIYDGFSGPDAPDFLMSHLYRAVDEELEGLLWDYEDLPSSDPSNPDHLKAEIPEPAPDMPPSDPSSEVISSCNLAESWTPGHLGSESSCSEIVEGKEKGGMNLQVNCTKTTSISEAASTPTASITGQGRKSKRLYELLQMEPWNGQSSLLIDEQRKGSCHCTSDCLGSGEASQEEQLRCSSSLDTVGECSSHQGEDPTTSGVKVDCSRQDDLAASLSGQRQNPGLLFLGSKIRKMYRKQKSLRKKLFLWSYDWHREETCVDEKPAEQIGPTRRCKSSSVDHALVLRAMARALERTEEAYMEMVEEALDKNPELALMGSCVLVMLMKDQDVYVMNLGDSRVILAQERPSDRHNNQCFVKDDTRHGNRSSRESLVRMELDRISEESPMHNQNAQVNKINKSKEISVCRLKMRAVQLSTDHSTSVEEEVSRIKAEHPDDNQAILNDRVKGQLKVTRAFGAGFLKRPSCNKALLEMFRVDYVGNAPYISCIPNVIHHRLSSSDRFLVLSSDGLYQYFSNEEVVAHVTWFMENVPDGDPAQYLIAELLFRAAKKNGMDFHELLDIPHGDRRKYHDDVYVMVVSLEGRIWRSSG